MATDRKLLDYNEVLSRLSERISNMSEHETRSLLIELEKRHQLKLNERKKYLGQHASFTEKREHPRQHASIYVFSATNINSFRDFTRNISAGGLFIVTSTHFLLLNTDLSMRFSLPGIGFPINIIGKIVRIDRNGIGVKFNEIMNLPLIHPIGNQNT